MILHASFLFSIGLVVWCNCLAFKLSCQQHVIRYKLYGGVGQCWFAPIFDTPFSPSTLSGIQGWWHCQFLTRYHAEEKHLLTKMNHDGVLLFTYKAPKQKKDHLTNFCKVRHKNCTRPAMGWGKTFQQVTIALITSLFINWIIGRNKTKNTFVGDLL